MQSARGFGGQASLAERSLWTRELEPKIKKKKKREDRPGSHSSRLKMAELELGHQRPSAASGTGTMSPELSFEDVSVYVPRRQRGSFWSRGERRPVVAHASGAFPRGTVTALLGPSGAGKTTLMSVLMRRIPCSAADLRFRELRLTRSIAKSFFAFCRQGDDQVLSDFTVAEQLDLAITLQSRVAGGAKVEFRNELCRDLGILHTLNVRGGKISGGERRRVSVALAMVSRPAVLVMDEPTSGLDSQAAKKLVESAHLLSRKRDTTVILSVHQPWVLGEAREKGEGREWEGGEGREGKAREEK